MNITGPNWTLLVGDNRSTLDTLPAASVHAVVTSPPYWGLRSYDTGDDKHLELGSEPTIEEFLANQIDVFRKVRRVLRDDGVCFVNLGDSYNSTPVGSFNGGGFSDSCAGRDMSGVATSGRIDKFAASGLPTGSQLLVPHRFALAMQADGWTLRSTIIWAKRSPMPESLGGWKWVRCRVKVAPQAEGTQSRAGRVTAKARDCIGGEWQGSAVWSPCPGCPKCSATDGLVLRRGNWRPTTAHEYVFMFAKSDRYFCDGEACKEIAVGGTPGNKTHKGVDAYAAGDEKMRTKAGLTEMGASTHRNPRSVWTLSTEPLKAKHFAAFPHELVRRCLAPAISPGGCCSACGAQLAPIVEALRIATRPGENTKAGKREAAVECGSRPGRESDPNLVGNRDPQRHVTSTTTSGYRPTCSCNAAVARPVVMDPYAGSGTTGRVAIHLGADFVGCELSETYATTIAAPRLDERWTPKTQKKPAKKRKQKSPQRTLF